MSHVQRQLERIDPTGRLDVLAFRIVERLAQRHCYPQEWRVLEAPTWELCRRLAPRPRRPRRRIH